MTFLSEKITEMNGADMACWSAPGASSRGWRHMLAQTCLRESPVDILAMKKPYQFNALLFCLYSKPVIPNLDAKNSLESPRFS